MIIEQDKPECFSDFIRLNELWITSGAKDLFWNFSAIIVDLRTGALVAAATPELRELDRKKINAILRQFLDDIPPAKK